MQLRKQTGFTLLILVFSLALLIVPTFAQDMELAESPMLTEMVDAGELPPVAERVPSNPMIVEPLEEVGQYGGTWRFGLSGGADDFFFMRTIGYEPLLRWTPAWDGWIPNVAASLDVNEDSTEFTFTLREGMKWNDGDDFNTADIDFWWNNIILNEELTPSISSIYQAGGEVAQLEIIDEVTFKFTFAAPFGFFPLRMATTAGIGPINNPRHYLEQFHPDFNEDAVTQAESAGYATWVDYFAFVNEADGIGTNPDKPTLNPWKLTGMYPGGDNVIVAERNPYYWKVDTAGNQLPYIDRVQMFVAEDVETLVLQGLNGDIDMQARHIGTLPNKPIFFDAQEDGNFRLYDLKSSWGNAVCLYTNLSTQDPVLSELFLNKDFRIALSHGINRQEIIDLVFLGQATPSQYAPHLDGPFANEQMSFQYTEYDVELANQMLDEIIPERSSDGFRLGPDGESLVITADVASSRTPDTDTLQLIAQQWREIGINLNVNVIDRSIQWERKAANESEIFVWPAGGGGGLDVLLNVQAYFPDRSAAFQAPAWGDWYATNGAEGIEPLPEFQQMMEMYRELQGIGDQEEQIALMNEIIQISADFFPQICTNTQPDLFGIVNNDLRNVPTEMIQSATWPDPAPTNPEQYFFTN